MLRIVVAFVLFFAAAAPAVAQQASPNDTARFLAGLPVDVGSPLARWTAEPGWRAHASELDRTWARLERTSLSRMRTWGADHLETARPTLFYMFSGPDALYAQVFFPEAETYILSGLEPVGSLPLVTETNRRGLGRLRSAIGTAVNLSFFKTIDMRSDLAGTSLAGTLPLIYLFLARAGKTIEEAALVRLSPSGEAVAADDPAVRNQPLGARIRFSDPERKGRTLYYFQIDVSNSGPHVAAFLDFCRSFGSGDAFVKSASYLMHADSFSRVREFLLGSALVILQDDSGIPARFFSEAQWQLSPFGRYLGPIPLFAGRYQPRLAEIFGKGRAEPLPFGIGYRYQQSESNLLLARRKPE